MLSLVRGNGTHLAIGMLQPSIERVTMASEVEIHFLSVHQALPLRAAVLRSGRPVQDAILPGDDAEQTIHLGAFADGQLVAVASLFHEPPPLESNSSAWRLRGMAVSPPAQGKGYGRALLQACFNHVAAQGGTVLWCNARATAKGFYLSCGFEVQGEEFEIPGIGPHFVMLRCINAEYYVAA
jgi:predicted GNAT family N-acyltransferase